MILLPLRLRMTLWLAVVLAVSLLLFGATVYLGVQRHLTQQLEKSLIEQARTIGEEIMVDADARGQQYAVTEINESFEPEINERFIRVTKQGGGVLYRSRSPRDLSFDPNAVAMVTSTDAQGYPSRRIEIAGTALIVQGLVYTAPNGSRFLIETGAPYRIIASELRSIGFEFALGIPVFLAVAVVGGLILIRHSLEPIRAITEQAERISSENINQRLPVVRTGDEIERLALSLNRMINRLDESIQQISRFSADVSHELRTPLTILRGELETAAGQSRDNPEMVGNALEEIDRLTRIVDQLLIISRLDAGQAGMERGEVDLGELARDTGEQMRLLADEKNISISYAIEPDTLVWGDALRLKQVLVNLLDNAVKYTPNGGHVEVGVRRGPKAMLAVRDSGIGIPTEALPHVFERFYRADKARSRSTGGTGLGLSIVMAIVTAHEGTVVVNSRVGVGTGIEVELPLATNKIDSIGARDRSAARIARAPFTAIAVGRTDVVGKG